MVPTISPSPSDRQPVEGEQEGLHPVFYFSGMMLALSAGLFWAAFG